MIFLVDIILLCPSLAVALAVDRSRYAAQDRLNVHSRGLGTGTCSSCYGQPPGIRKKNKFSTASFTGPRPGQYWSNKNEMHRCLVLGNDIELDTVGRQCEPYRWRPCGVTWDEQCLLLSLGKTVHRRRSYAFFSGYKRTSTDLMNIRSPKPHNSVSPCSSFAPNIVFCTV